MTPVKTSLEPGPDGVRRRYLASSLAAAFPLTLGGGVALAQTDSAAASARWSDMSCRVQAARLDAMVAQAYSLFNKPVVLPAFDAAGHGAKNDVDLYRLITQVDLPETGEKLQVTGLLALPVGPARELPVVSWQHGTVLSFGQVPSNMLRLKDPAYRMSDEQDSLETLFNVQRLAGQGFAVIAADYVGKGPLRKDRGEAYAVKEVTERTCAAILDAGLAQMQALHIKPGKLFLNGWSQGGLNTQWLHQLLRKQSRQVTATAVASPFNDLSEAWRFWAGVQAFPLPEGATSYPAMPEWVSLCMIVALGSYELNYRLDGLLKSAIRPEYHQMALKYWSDYKLDFDPAKPFPSGRNLLVSGFFERFTDERNSAFLRRMAANTSTYWRYDSPIRFYHGLADEAIHPAMVGRALAAGGEQASGVPVAGASHRGTFLASLYGDPSTLGGKQNVVVWFGSEL